MLERLDTVHEYGKYIENDFTLYELIAGGFHGWSLTSESYQRKPP